MNQKLIRDFATSVLFLGLLNSAGFAQVELPNDLRSDLHARFAKEFVFTYDSLAPINYLPVHADGLIHPDIRGVWKARGYGFVVEFGEKEFRWFSETTSHCWEHTPDEPLDMIFAIIAASGRCYVKPFPTESAYVLERMDSLPAHFAEEPSFDQVAMLHTIDETMSEFYPFFEKRKHDWRQRMAEAQPKVNGKTSELDLFRVVEGMFEGLGDGHTSVVAEIDGEELETQGPMSSIRSALEADFALKKDLISRQEYFVDWSNRLTEGIKDDLLHGNSKAAYGETILWGKVSAKVGYLTIRNMARYFDDENDLAASLKALHIQLEKVFEEFVDCEALIIDVTVNSGGFHSFALAFASHIADQERYVCCKYPLGSPDLIQKFHVLPYRDSSGLEKTFTKPVYVVVSDATVSAGEEFVLAARAFPHVKIVGTPTQGMLSDILEKPLPNGWTLNLSNEIFLDHLGKCHEVVGIPVDTNRQIFDLENIEQIGLVESIQTLALEAIEK